MPTARELNIGIVAYSPLGRGFLTGAISSPADLADDDFRKANPRFAEDAFEANMTVVHRLEEVASTKGVTAGQLALAWVQSRGDDVVPIPGTKRRTYLEQNVEAATLELSADELAQIDAVAPSSAFTGTRYPEGAMRGVGI